MMSEGVSQDTLFDSPAEVIEETEKPAAEADGEERFSKRDIRRNMTFLVMLDTIWITGWSDFQVALMPLLVFLSASNKEIGIIQGAGAAALFGIVVSPWITRLFKYKKWYLIGANLPYMGAIGVAGVVLLFSRQLELSNAWLLSFILVMMLLHHFFAGFTNLPHQEYVAACMPVSHRGRLFGLSFTTGSAASIGSAALGGLILLHYAKPMAFGYLFLMTWALCQGGYIFAAFAKELPTPVEKSPKPWSMDMLKAAWHDEPYKRFMMFLVLNCLQDAVLNFVAVYGLKELGMHLATAAVIMIIGQAARIPSSIVGGLLVDKIGPRRIFVTWPLVIALPLIPLLMMHSAMGVYVFFALAGIGKTLWNGAYAVLVYSLPKPENRAGHYTLQTLLQYGCNAVAPILAGCLLDVVTFRSAFIGVGIGVMVFYPFIIWVASTFSSIRGDSDKSTSAKET